MGSDVISCINECNGKKLATAGPNHKLAQTPYDAFFDAI
jgi:hypothetical protein